MAFVYNGLLERIRHCPPQYGKGRYAASLRGFAEPLETFKRGVDKNGNLGGIIAFNSTDGQISKCMSGNWFLSNKSTAIGVGTGGIIGMNESEKDITGLINAAFVGRQLASADTNRRSRYLLMLIRWMSCMQRLPEWYL